MSDVIYFNQYLGMELVCDGYGGVLQVQQRKIEEGFKELGLEDSNIMKVLIEGYLQLLSDRY